MFGFLKFIIKIINVFIIRGGKAYVNPIRYAYSQIYSKCKSNIHIYSRCDDI